MRTKVSNQPANQPDHPGLSIAAALLVAAFALLLNTTPAHAVDICKRTTDASGITISSPEVSCINPEGSTLHKIDSTTSGIQIINRGNIMKTVDGEEGYIATAQDNSPITNYGTIEKSAYTSGNNSPVINYGTVGQVLRTGGLDGLTGIGSYIINYGHVGFDEENIGFGEETISMFGPDPTLTVMPGSTVVGPIVMALLYPGSIDPRDSDSTSTLNVVSGQSVAYSFGYIVKDEEPVNPGYTPDVINTYGAPYAVSGYQVAVVDPTNLAAQDELLTDLTTGFFSTLPRGPARSLGIWMQGFGTYRYLEGKGAAVDSSYHLTGGVVGSDLLTDGDRTHVGLFFGGASGNVEADFDSQETGVTSFFGGVYGTKETESTVIDAALALGYSDFDNSRRIANNMSATGLETATANYGGFFVSPQVTVTRPFRIFGQRIEPSVTLRYAGLFLGGFTESRTTAPLTVDSRGLHLGLARAQLAVPILGQDGGRTRLTVRGGVEGRTLLAGDEVSGSLLGKGISFDPGGYDEAGVGFVGIAAQHKLKNGVVLFAGGEGLVETNGSYRARAQAGLRF